ncbi:MAG: DUF711 family protein [Ruminococcus sp.]
MTKSHRRAEKLVATGEIIEKEYGIPIINKRIAVTPIAMLAAACPKDSPVKFAKALQRAAETRGVKLRWRLFCTGTQGLQCRRSWH